MCKPLCCRLVSVAERGSYAYLVAGRVISRTRTALRWRCRPPGAHSQWCLALCGRRSRLSCTPSRTLQAASVSQTSSPTSSTSSHIGSPSSLPSLPKNTPSVSPMAHWVGTTWTAGLRLEATACRDMSYALLHAGSDRRLFWPAMLPVGSVVVLTGRSTAAGAVVGMSEVWYTDP